MRLAFQETKSVSYCYTHTVSYTQNAYNSVSGAVYEYLIIYPSCLFQLGYHRPRCNTEIKLDKLKRDRKNVPKVSTVLWREPNEDEAPTEEQLDEFFPAKRLGQQG